MGVCWNCFCVLVFVGEHYNCKHTWLYLTSAMSSFRQLPRHGAARHVAVLPSMVKEILLFPRPASSFYISTERCQDLSSSQFQQQASKLNFLTIECFHPITFSHPSPSSEVTLLLSCVCMRECVHVCLCAFASKYMCVQRVCLYVLMCVFVHMCAWVRVCMCVHGCTCQWV